MRRIGEGGQVKNLQKYFNQGWARMNAVGHGCWAGTDGAADSSGGGRRRRCWRRDDLEHEFLLLGLAAAAEADGKGNGVGAEPDAGDHGLGLGGGTGGNGDFSRLDDEIAEVGVEIEDFDFSGFCAVIGEA